MIMNKKIMSISINIFFVFFALHVHSQIKRTNPFLLLESRRANQFVDEKGKGVGCNGMLDCMSFDLAFYSANYDPKKREFSIKGTAYIGRTERDSITLGSVYLFLAKPVRNSLANLRDDTLTNKREIGVTIRDKNKAAVFPNRRGDFNLKFIAEPNDKLYFFHPGYGLVEYNIDKVVSGEVAL
jgi:hypothetical protein